jgi:O-antigen/teichoic acid export membrane protein
MRWSVLTGGARFALQLIAQVLLARQLGPAAFGLFAIGMVAITLAGFVAGFGLSWSLMQRAKLDNEDIRFAWTWQVLAGLAALLLLQMLAPSVAAAFKEPAAEPVIRWLSLSCLLQAAAAPATHLLTRELNFKALGLIQLLSYAVGYGLVGLPLAWAGQGANALVAAWLVQAAVTVLASTAMRPHPMAPLLWYPRAAQTLSTGQAVFVTNLVNWALANLDRVLIGRLLGTWSLGLYNVAYNLATVPNSVLLGALQPAFLAAGAQMNAHPGRLAQAYLQMLATLLVLALPVFTGLALMANDLVMVLYGARWQAAGPVLAWLMACMPALAIWGIATPVLWNSGRPHHEWALQLPLIGVGVLALWLAAPLGIMAAAMAVGLLGLSRALVLTGAALHALHLHWASLAQPALRGLGLTAGVAATMLALQQPLAEAAPLARLAASALAPTLAVALLLWLRPRWCQGAVGPQAWAMVLRFAPVLGGRTRDPQTGAAGLPSQQH